MYQIISLYILEGQQGLLGGGKKKSGWGIALPGCQDASKTDAEG